MAFYNGLLSYTAGVDSACAGSKDLAAGTSELKNGTDDMIYGITKLYAGSKLLVEGAGQLNNGSLELKNGVQEYYDEGIKKIVDAMDGDFEGLFERLRAIADAGRNYQSFAGKSENMSGSVKFIYRTNEI